ncbi:MAG: hypothetical protein WBL80_09505 [Erysipelotrichaceae bacterium]
MKKFVMILGLVAILSLAVPAANLLKEGNAEERRIRTQEAIQRALNLCYAQEGFYPARLDYLIEHYGIIISSDNYYVYYKTIGSNIRPDVTVFRKGK